MEDIAATQPVGDFHLCDANQDLGELATRDGRIHAHVVGADATARREGVHAAAPELQALGFAAADVEAGGASGFEHRDHAADLLLDFFRRAVALADQDRSGVEVVAGVDVVLDRRRHRLVHHLQAGRDDSRADQRCDGVARLAHVVEAGEDGARELWLGHQLDRHLERDGEHAFRADDHRKQVETGAVERLAAELDRLTFHGVAPHPQHVVDRQAVLQAMHAARVFGDVAADGAGDLAARVRRVVQTMARRGLADRRIAHAALHDGRAADRIDLQDAVELGQTQRHAHGVGQGATRQPRARPARHDGDLHGVTRPQHRGDLGLGLGQGDGEGLLPVSGEAIAFVRHGVLCVPEQGVSRQHRRQRGHHLLLAQRALGRAAGGSQGLRCRWEGCIHWGTS